jgi:hypothetical protein
MSHCAGASISPYWDPDATPYDLPSNVIPHVSAARPVAIGEGDRWVEPFDFRLCFTKSSSHQLRFSRPASYNGSEFEYWRRLYEKKPPSSLSQAGLGCLGELRRAALARHRVTLARHAPAALAAPASMLLLSPSPGACWSVYPDRPDLRQRCRSHPPFVH